MNYFPPPFPWPSPNHSGNQQDEQAAFLPPLPLVQENQFPPCYWPQVFPYPSDGLEPSIKKEQEGIHPVKKEELLDDHLVKDEPGFDVKNEEPRNDIPVDKKKANEKARHSKKKGKNLDDPEYRIKTKKAEKKGSQNPARNKNSNIFRAFLKMLQCKAYSKKLECILCQLRQTRGFKIEADQFLQFLKSNAPKTTNYINKHEFQKLYYGKSQPEQLIRILFHYFIRNQGFPCILQMVTKQKLQSESAIRFFQGLREVEDEIAK